MSIRLLVPGDVAAYRALRFAALAERPPAFGALPEEEPDATQMADRLSTTADRAFFGAFDGESLVGTVRLSRYSASNEKHRAYLAGLFVSPPQRRQGQAKGLVAAALDRALSDPALRRLNLTVVSGQHAAIRLYTRRSTNAM